MSVSLKKTLPQPPQRTPASKGSTLTSTSTPKPWSSAPSSSAPCSAPGSSTRMGVGRDAFFLGLPRDLPLDLPRLAFPRTTVLSGGATLFISARLFAAPEPAGLRWDEDGEASLMPACTARVSLALAVAASAALAGFFLRPLPRCEG